MTLREFSDTLKKYGTENNIKVSHNQSQENAYPYLVFSEYGISYTFASGRAVKRHTNIAVALYTQNDFDPVFSALEKTLLEKVFTPVFTVAWNREERIVEYQGELKLTEDLGFTQ